MERRKKKRKCGFSEEFDDSEPKVWRIPADILGNPDSGRVTPSRVVRSNACRYLKQSWEPRLSSLSYDHPPPKKIQWCFWRNWRNDFFSLQLPKNKHFRTCQYWLFLWAQPFFESFNCNEQILRLRHWNQPKMCSLSMLIVKLFHL